MKTPLPEVPTYERALEDLDQVISHVSQAIDHGLMEGRHFFHSRAEDVDASLLGHLVRYSARIWLDARGRRAVNEEDLEGDSEASTDVDYLRQRLGNNGLCLSTDSYKLRVWRAERDGRIPDPGNSREKQRFLRQEQQLALIVDDTVDSVQTNLALLWDFDQRTYELSQMWLACPKAYVKRTKSIKTHWSERVVHARPEVSAPAQLKRTRSRPSPVATDLPIKLKSVPDPAR